MLLSLSELNKQWKGKLVEVSRPCTPEEKEYYQCDTFGGVYEECYFYQNRSGCIYISSDSNLDQLLTEDTTIKLYIPPIDVPVKPLKSWS